ncbi:MAG: right-handed parallel beta-helix repeat-containing protein [Rhodospirillaceae bacterium]
MSGPFSPNAAGRPAARSSLHARRAPCIALVAALFVAPARAQTVTIAPETDAAAAVAAAPAGTAFVFAPGVHRLAAPIVPKDGDSFAGRPGAVLSGAAPLSGFVREGAFWVLARAFAETGGHGACRRAADGTGRIACRFAEELFVDGAPAPRAESAEDVDAAGWHLDAGRGRLVLGFDPAGRTVELAAAPAAFAGPARGVAIRGLVVERFANPAQRGAIQGMESESWTVEGNVVRFNHGLGIRVGPRMRVTGNRVHDNGQLGIGGNGNDVVVEGNAIVGNNRLGFDPEWEAGGAKFVLTHRLVLRGNCVAGNGGSGLWTDINADDTLVEGNVVVGNANAGIQHEIGGRTVIRGNLAAFNGRAKDVWLWGAQILVQNSRDTVVEDNTVVVAADGGAGIALVHQRRLDGYGNPALTVRNTVRGNRIVYLGGDGRSGAVADADPDVLLGGGNVFAANRYVGVDPGRAAWAWGGRMLAWADFRAAGHEAGGSLASGVAAALAPVDGALSGRCAAPG